MTMKRDLKQDNIIRRVLKEYKSFALLGMSGDPVRPSYFVGTYFALHHFNFVCINPKYKELFNKPCYPRLQDIHPAPEVLAVFRRAEETPQIAEEALRWGIKVLWLQFGIRNEETKKIAERGGLLFVQDRCLKVEHARFLGNLHQTGFNTGVISSKRRHSDFFNDPVNVTSGSACSIQ